MDLEPGGINHLPYAGGGEVLTPLLSGTSEVGSAPWATSPTRSRTTVPSGDRDLLPERLECMDVPTIGEQDYDLEMSNWRGVVAPPGLSEEESARSEDLVAELVSTDTWTGTLERNRRTDTYQDREEFETFFDEEVTMTQETVEELGL